ncbi:hypothetical protein Y032_0203g1853 [Ancylostoma ceylanicum]|nr:hypothetical protein Y032_0203g1853 [Ancylostoma ceylanicum]
MTGGPNEPIRVPWLRPSFPHDDTHPHCEARRGDEFPPFGVISSSLTCKLCVCSMVKSRAQYGKKVWLNAESFRLCATAKAYCGYNDYESLKAFEEILSTLLSAILQHRVFWIFGLVKEVATTT